MRMRYITKCLLIVAVIFATAAVCDQALDAKAQNGERNQIEVVLDGEAFTYYDYEITPTNHLVEEQLFLRRINDSPKQKSCFVRSLVDKGVSPEKALIYAYPRLEAFVSNLSASIKKEAKNATITFNPDKKPVFTLTRDKNGRRLDEQALYASIFRAWQSCVSAKIEATTLPVRAEFTIDDAKAQTYLRGKFSTDFSASSSNRKYNVALAMSKINGYILPSGESFSFNGVVGGRTEKNGFKQAKIIIDGEYVDGVGGGVCQVSTTLYNAVLLANLPVEKVSSHSLAPSYVSPSFDAMVNQGSSDLTFGNDTKFPVYIKATCENGEATVEIYGSRNPYEIKQKSVITEYGSVPEDKIVEDVEGKFVTDEMQSGESVRVRGSIAGFRSEGYLLYYKDGVLESKKLIRRDKYLPIRGIIAKKP